VAKVGTGGKVSIRNGSAGVTQLVADVAGYFVAWTVTAAGGVTAVTPYRLLDTRKSEGGTGPLAGNGTRTVATAGRGGVPATGVSAVVVNLTAVTPVMAGYLSAYPTGGAIPNASNVNFTPGPAVPNLALIKVSSDGSFTVRNGSPGMTEVVADVAGYVLGGTPTGPGLYVPVDPGRLLDTRPAFGGTGPVAAFGVKTLPVVGKAGLPGAAGVSGVVVNVTVVAGAADGYLTVYPADAAQTPFAANLNFWPRQELQNLVAAKTSAAGAIAIYNGSPGPNNLVVDVAGYFTA
jgi:hypothetical protein